MGIFNNILGKLGFGKKEEEAKPASKAEAPAPSKAEPTPAAAAPATPAAAAPTPISEVDVVAKLEGLAASHAENLNWKTSIVDLMKLLGLDSSYGERKELAAELGCPADKMGDSAQMNMWLHKEVMKKLAENGGNIPAELLD